MTQHTPGAGFGRGAIDLGRLSGPTNPAASAPAPGAGGPAGGPAAGAATSPVAGVPAGLVIEATDATFNEVVSGTVRVPAVVVIWSASAPESEQLRQDVRTIAASREGRLQVVEINADTNPGILQALQAQQLPIALGLVQGQPVPLFAGAIPADQLRGVLDQLLALALQHGVTGRVELGSATQVDEMPPLPPLHAEAYDAIDRGDLDAAVAAYTQALKQNPKDHDAEIGLAQVGLLRRTSDVDPQAIRSAAAEAPDDVDAQLAVADLDVLGGHIGDAFTRLIDLVVRTADEDRERVRAHLLELFAVVGNHDERVRKARTALMSALF
ncbi:tetratricopeptide repeat protein [Janibacter sp. G1551]|uniref:co-chaperone YbbN n=1 Tax=Janibacter sp. G1551 TaxID=3420440 RepID=UPI003D04385A